MGIISLWTFEDIIVFIVISVEILEGSPAEIRITFFDVIIYKAL